MTDIAHLESVAQQLAARVRDDDPEANLRWLRAELGTMPMFGPATVWEQLLFILAAAVPDDRTWGQLVGWADRRVGVSPVRYRPSTPEEQALRREAVDEALGGNEFRARTREGGRRSWAVRRGKEAV